MTDKTVKIYQIYYLPEQVSKLDPAFEPYDNCNPIWGLDTSRKLREYPVMRKTGYQRAQDEKADIWGFVSHKWQEKTNIPGQKFVDFIKANPDNDVWFMEPMFHPFNPFMNPWLHGDIHHPGISEIPNSFVTFTDKKIDVRKIPMPLCFYNFFAGTKLFWDTFFKFNDRMVELANQNPNLYKALFETSAGHGNDLTVPFFIFVIERMMPTTITLTNMRWAGLKYRHGDFNVLENELLDFLNKTY